MDQTKFKEVFSDKAYVESIAKLSPEEAAKSLNEKGVEITAEDLIKVHDFMVAHKEELENGELSEETLAEVAGGMSEAAIGGILAGGLSAIAIGVLCLIAPW